MSDDIVCFGTFELDRSTGELRRGGQRVPLQDQPAQVLSLLVSRPGTLVTREELRNALWSEDTFVDFDTAVNVAVNKVRQALRDSATTPRFVETVPKRGYRVLADVRPVEPGAPAETSPASGPRLKTIAWVAGGVVAASLVVAVAALPVQLPWSRPSLPAVPGTIAPQPTNAAAYDRYLSARHLIARRTSVDSRRAAELLEEAVALDPRSAPAQAALADAYLSAAWLDDEREPFLPRARRAALRALELDPNRADAHATLGAILSQFDWDSEAGERELKRAVELGPQDAVALRFYSVFLWQEGRFDEALALNERELALDSASPYANRNRGIILYYARRYEESVEQSRKTLELDRYFVTVYLWMGRALEQLGRDQEAVEAFVAPLTFSETWQKDVPALRAAAASGGLRAFWSKWLELKVSRSDNEALAWLKVGDRDRALHSLEHMCDQRRPSVRTIKAEPQWDPVRSDPRFQALLRKARLQGP